MELDLLSKQLKWYKKGEWVYPGVLVRKLNVSADRIYKIMELLKDNNIVEVNYEFYCHECNQFKIPIYSSFIDIPEASLCEKCDTKLSFKNNIIVIYKVIDDGN